MVHELFITLCTNTALIMNPFTCQPMSVRPYLCLDVQTYIEKIIKIGITKLGHLLY